MTHAEFSLLHADTRTLAELSRLGRPREGSVFARIRRFVAGLRGRRPLALQGEVVGRRRITTWTPDGREQTEYVLRLVIDEAVELAPGRPARSRRLDRNWKCSPQAFGAAAEACRVVACADPEGRIQTLIPVENLRP